MKAIVCTKYGLPGGLEVKDVEKPAPKEDEVLVEVRASSVTTATVIGASGKPFFVRLMGQGLFSPAVKIPGVDVAGRVAAAGRNVTQFKPGDEVYGLLFNSGAYAEYVCAGEAALASKPANLSFEEAAGVPEAALVALQGLRDKGRIRRGQKVLIYGASGGIGSFAVQIAKYYGAEVTGVCSTKNLDLVRSLGADQVVDYIRDDYTQSGTRYDLIFGIAYRSIFDHVGALAPQGVYVSAGGPSLRRVFQDMLLGPGLSRKDGKQVVGGWMVELNQKDLIFMKELIETGKVKAVVDRCYALSESAQAFRRYAQGHPAGKVIVRVKPA